MDSEIWFSLIAIVYLIYEAHGSGEHGQSLTKFAVATQSSTYASNGINGSADKVLDGCFYQQNCIARTMAMQNNWIQIDLGNIFKVRSIVIHNVKVDIWDVCDLYIELSKTQSDSVSECLSPKCSAAKTEVLTIRSSDDGDPLPDSRFITLRRDYAALVIAEITVFGECPDNYCGANCTEFCFCRKTLSNLEKTQGQNCRGGCLSGWTGHRCSIRKCAERMFGCSCSYACHCLHQCDPWTGECIGPDRRCFLGWRGPSCQKYNTHQEMDTRNKRFNDDDISTCYQARSEESISFPKRNVSHISIIVKQEPCANNAVDLEDSPTRVSPIGGHETCKAQEVEPVVCGSVSKASFLCKAVDTMTLKLSNIKGRICEIELFVCSAGSFGPDCNTRCHCLEAQCNSVDGTCHGDGKCQPGWTGKACDTPCTSGFYGTNCIYPCGYCADSEPCDPMTGHCYTGCIHPKKEPFCQEDENTDFKHKPADDDKKCNCLDGIPCDNAMRKCGNGCSAGTNDSSCKHACVFGTYGINCSLSCGQCAANETCHTETGYCLNGCAHGWKGPFCQTTGHKETFVVAIVSGTVGSLVLASLLVLVIFVIKRRRKKTKIGLHQTESTLEMGNTEDNIHVYTDLSQETKDGGEHDYKEMQIYASLVKDSSSSIEIKKFPEIYKTLLSTWTDGRTRLFHAYQTLTSTEQTYQSIQLNRVDHFDEPTISYKDLVSKNECPSTSEIFDEREGSTQLLKLDDLSFVTSDDNVSQERFWKAFITHKITTCIQLGKTVRLNLNKGDQLNVKSFTIVCSMLKQRQSATQRTLSVKCLDPSFSFNIEIFSFETWEDCVDVPIDLLSVLDTIRNIRILQSKQGCVMIHCEQTIHKPILLSVATAVLVKMKESGLVDILGPTKAVWRTVPSSIGTYEQFRFLHDIVLLAIKKKRFIK